MWACRKFRNYITHGSVIVVTDHKCLLSLRTPNKEFKNDRLARWAVELDQYDMLLAHRPGRHLFMPDMLSRAVMECDQCEIDEVVRKSWGRTADLIMDYPHWMKDVLKPGAQQLRLRAQIAGAIVSAQRGLPEMTVHEAVQAVQKGEYQAEAVRVNEP